jgi:AraC family transcriptional regulator
MPHAEGWDVIAIRGRPAALPDAEGSVVLFRQAAGAGRVATAGDAPLGLASGDLVLYAGEAPRYEADEDSAGVSVALDQRRLADVAWSDLGARIAPRPTVPVRRLADPCLAELCRALGRISAADARDRVTIGALARAVAARLVARHLLAETTAVALDGRIARVLAHIEENLDGDLRLETLAGVAGLSAFHFSRLFSSRLGTGLGAYVRRRRIDRAKMLLLTAAPLAEVAFACGFAHQSHFTSVFREATGSTPGAYRSAACPATEPAPPGVH